MPNTNPNGDQPVSEGLPLETIICGDNVSVMSQWPDECIDLTVTSPPYDLVAPDADGNLITQPGGLRTYDGYTWDFAAVARQLWRVTKRGGVVVWVVGDATINGSETGSSFRQVLYFMEIGFNLHDTMIFNRNGQYPDPKRYNADFEYMFILSKNRPNTINLIRDKANATFGRKISGTDRQKNGQLIPVAGLGQSISELGIRSNIWRYSTGFGGTTNDKEAFEQPAIFPESLAADHVTSWSDPEMIILDPFCGSGTTCKMAHILDRRYIGVDISENYCNLARRRVANVERERRGEWKPLAGAGGDLAGLPLFEAIE